MPPDLIKRLTLHGGVIPGAVALVVLGLLWWRHTRRLKRSASGGDGAPVPPTAADGPRWALPLLMALGFVAADWVVKQSLDVWPKDNTKRALHAGLVLGLFGLVEGLVRLPEWARTVGRSVVYGLVTWMLIEGYAGSGWISRPDLWGWVFAVGVVGSLAAMAADRGTESTPGWTGVLAWVVVLGAFQPLLNLEGFALGSMALTGAIAVLTSAMLVSLVCRGLNPARGAVSVMVGLVLAGLLGAGIQSEPASVPVLALLGGMPLAMSVRAGGTKRTLLARLAVVGMLGLCAMLVLRADTATHDAPPAADDPYGSYYGS